LGLKPIKKLIFFPALKGRAIQGRAIQGKAIQSRSIQANDNLNAHQHKTLITNSNSH
jgi:hypothetical protein